MEIEDRKSYDSEYYRKNKFTKLSHDKKRRSSGEGKLRYSAYQKKYYDRYKTKARNRHLKKCFGIDLTQYNELFKNQDGCCAICSIHQSNLNKALAVDHCHKTNTVRGLLCSDCNTTLGKFKDDPEIFMAAINYLKKYT